MEIISRMAKFQTYIRNLLVLFHDYRTKAYYNTSIKWEYIKIYWKTLVNSKAPKSNRLFSNKKKLNQFRFPRPEESSLARYLLTFNPTIKEFELNLNRIRTKLEVH